MFSTASGRCTFAPRLPWPDVGVDCCVLMLLIATWWCVCAACCSGSWLTRSKLSLLDNPCEGVNAAASAMLPRPIIVVPAIRTKLSGRADGRRSWRLGCFTGSRDWDVSTTVTTLSSSVSRMIDRCDPWHPLTRRRPAMYRCLVSSSINARIESMTSVRISGYRIREGMAVSVSQSPSISWHRRKPSTNERAGGDQPCTDACQQQESLQ